MIRQRDLYKRPASSGHLSERQSLQSNQEMLLSVTVLATEDQTGTLPFVRGSKSTLAGRGVMSRTCLYARRRPQPYRTGPAFQFLVLLDFESLSYRMPYILVNDICRKCITSRHMFTDCEDHIEQACTCSQPKLLTQHRVQVTRIIATHPHGRLAKRAHGWPLVRP